LKGAIEIPKKSYSKGAKKALRSMRRRYGKTKGEQVFYAKANKYGRGKSRLRKINSVYKKGGRAKARRR
jgi:hypothetical protein